MARLRDDRHRHLHVGDGHGERQRRAAQHRRSLRQRPPDRAVGHHRPCADDQHPAAPHGAARRHDRPQAGLHDRAGDLLPRRPGRGLRAEHGHAHRGEAVPGDRLGNDPGERHGGGAFRLSRSGARQGPGLPPERRRCGIDIWAGPRRGAGDRPGLALRVLLQRAPCARGAAGVGGRAQLRRARPRQAGGPERAVRLGRRCACRARCSSSS